MNGSITMITVSKYNLISMLILIGVHRQFKPRREKTCLRCFRPGPTGFDINRAVQPQKIARGF